jgi:UDP-N-acetylglucosamine diphosphorylase/glucosamine-1-phosphate N-acetyltransferase
MRICIFEDNRYTNFLPLAYFRPVYELRCGAFSLREKLAMALPGTKQILHVRSELAGYLSEEFTKLHINNLPDDDIWFINGRILADENLAKFIKQKTGEQKVFLGGDDVGAVFIKKDSISDFKKKLIESPIDKSIFKVLTAENFPFALINYTWELVHRTTSEIEKDFNRLKTAKRISGKLYPGVHLINKRNIIIGNGSIIKSGAVIDAENGPVIIGKNVTIMPNAVVEGPVFIGDNSIIKIGAKIYHGTSIGEYCKVGGEVEASIIQAYSNKQHEGFLGHSYLGSWVNLGADTNTSDLKNNYSTIRVRVNGQMIDSGSQFVGLTIGDHSKSGINVMFDTGTVVGVSCNIYGAGLPPKYMPSFAWGGEKEFTVYDLEKSIDTMKHVMIRRNMKMSESYEKLVRKVFKDTMHERQSSGVK